MTDQRPTIDWRDGVPIARAFDDPYYSLVGGLDETRHVFLAGNDLPARFGGNFCVGELGFGTGLNFLTTWQAWQQAGCPGTLTFTSFEAFPMAPADMAQALSAFPALSDLAQTLCRGWTPGDGPCEVAAGVTLRVVIGDARVTLPLWDGQADAWFLDGFSPATNPISSKNSMSTP